MVIAKPFHGLFLTLALIAVSASWGQGEAASSKSKRTLQKPPPATGVWFIPNEGQWAQEVKASARVHGGDL